MNALASPVIAAGIMDLNPGLTLWTAITFLVLIGVLWKFAFGPITQDAGRAGDAPSATPSTRPAPSGRRPRSCWREQKEALAKAQRDAAELAKRNQQEMEAFRAQLTAQARKEADELVASARKSIQEERKIAVAQLRAEVADLAVAAASRIVKSSLDEKTQRQLVDEYIKDLPAGRA